MPFYDYVCSSCNHTFEKRLSVEERNIPETEPCPNCGELKIAKNSGNTNHHTYGLGAEAKNNYGGFGEVLKRIDERTRPLGGKLKDYL